MHSLRAPAGSPLTEGSQINLPNLPVQINPPDVPPLEEPSSEQPEEPGQTGKENPPPVSGSEPQQEPGFAGLPNLSILQDLQFWLKMKNPDPSLLPPQAPLIVGNFSGCDVHLEWHNMGVYFDSSYPSPTPQDEDGFFLYRSRDGSPYERIATIPKVTGIVDSYNPLYYQALTDPNQYGQLTYYMSAFNTAGETASEPVVVPLNLTNCQPPYNPNSNAI